MSRCSKCALALAFLFVPSHFALADDHDHDHGHGAMEQCSCAAEEPSHPFVIDCDDGAAIQDAYDNFFANDCTDLVHGEPKCNDYDHYGDTCVMWYLLVQTHHDYCAYV